MGAGDFCPPCKLSGANWEVRHDRIFAAAKAPTGCITLAALYSAWAGGTEDIYQIFHFYPFGLPIAPRVLGVGVTELPHDDRAITDPC